MKGKIEFVLVGLLLAAGAAAGDEKVRQMTPEKLDRRCFVWKRNHCDTATDVADQRFVKSVTKKQSRGEAAKEIIRRSWRILDEGRDPITALFRFNQALILDEKNAEGWLGAGQSYAALGLVGDAEPLFLKSNQMAPNQAKTLLLLAWFYAAGKKDPDAAQKYYGEARKVGAPADERLEKLLKPDPSK